MDGLAVVDRNEVVPNGAHEAFAGGHGVQQVRGSYATAVAVQRPRSLPLVQRALAQEARLAGEDFYYGWSAGRERVEGPSVSLALAAARCWGNCAVETLPVQDLADAWVFTAAFVDLETGFTLSRQFRQSKRSAVGGKMDGERKDDVRFQVGQSKAIRNVVLNSLPSSLIRQAVEEAKKGVRAHIESLVEKKGLAGAVDAALRALAKAGVKEQAVLHKCGVAKRDAIGIDHLVTLKGDLTTIESGQERPEALFPPEAEAQPAALPPAATPTQQSQPALPDAAGPKAKKKTLQVIQDLGRKLGFAPTDWESLCGEMGVQTLGEMPERDAQSVIARLEDLVAQAEADAQREAAEERQALETHA